MNTPLEYTYDYYHVGGSLKPNAPSYVVRLADQELYNALMAGQFCYVLNTRQMGKSSLRVQTMQRLRKSGVSCAAVDITTIGSEHLTPENWYGGLVSSLWREFNLFSQVNQKNWLREHEELSLVQLLDRFIEEVLLMHVPGKRIVIFIDEIDSIISLKFSIDDFFALIRAYYNQRVDQPEYERLTFCLLGVATSSDLIKDKTRTPFNIGKTIALDGFKFESAQALEKGLVDKVSNPQEVLREILHWTGGQPFLTQKLCKLISEGSTVENPLAVEQVVRSQIIENWESQDQPEHLKTIRDRLLGNKDWAKQMLEIYQSILQHNEVDADNSDEQVQLRLTGLVVQHEGKLKIRNPIYMEVFHQNWLNNELEKLRHKDVASKHYQRHHLERYNEACYLRKHGYDIKYGNYDLRSLDGGKNWYAVNYDCEEDTVKIIGEANKVFPEILDTLKGLDNLISYVKCHGSITLGDRFDEEIELLQDAGFTISVRSSQDPQDLP